MSTEDNYYIGYMVIAFTQSAIWIFSAFTLLISTLFPESGCFVPRQTTKRNMPS